MSSITPYRGISLNQARSEFAERIGKRPSIPTMYRWRGKGFKGVRLKTFRVGQSWYVSPEAIDEFITHLTAQSDEAAGVQPEVDRDLEDAGLKRPREVHA